MSRTMRRKRSPHGVSTVELAVCLPVIVLIVFASIEACSMIYLQQTLQTAAYETARFAVTPRSTSDIASARGVQVLEDRRVTGGTITFTPDDLSTTPRGTYVVVRVSAAIADNRIMPDFFFGNQQLQAEVTMLRE